MKYKAGKEDKLSSLFYFRFPIVIIINSAIEHFVELQNSNKMYWQPKPNPQNINFACNEKVAAIKVVVIWTAAVQLVISMS